MTKPKRNERSIADTPPSKDARLWHRSNLTELARAAGKIRLSCDFCGLEFETYACWAKRYSAHFCSHACAGEYKKIPVEKHCVICGAVFTTNPTTAMRYVTCSRKCLIENRRRRMTKPSNGQHNQAEQSDVLHGEEKP